MIINPDGALIITLILNIILAWVVAIVLYKKSQMVLALLTFVVMIFTSIFTTEWSKQYFENKLVKLTQPITVKYKRSESTRNGNKYYLTATFNNGCVSDVLVNYQSYRQAEEGAIVMITPTYQIYDEVLKQDCRH